jgi:uncharacterized protein (DUF58 family)
MQQEFPRWQTLLGVSLLATAAGIWTLDPLFIFIAIPPIVLVLYSSLSTPADPTEVITLHRAVSPAQTYPGGTVSVEVQITNTSDQLLSDIRVIDGVPADLPVIAGSPRAMVDLNPGETETIEYRVRTRYGEYQFTPTRVRAYNISTTVADTVKIEPDGAQSLTAQVQLEDVDLATDTTQMPGQLATDSGGEGTAFYGIRSYQPEDPISRINWYQYAKDRELTTVEYREERTSDVMVLIDVRPQTVVARDATGPTGAELTLYSGSQLIQRLLTDRTRVGVSVLGVPDAALTENTAWISPGSGKDLYNRIQTLLDDAAVTIAEQQTDRSSDATEGVAPVDIVTQLNQQTQVIIVSPTHDDFIIELTRYLTTEHHAVQVYAPDVTTDVTVGGQLFAASRALRLAQLRQYGATVMDWDPAVPLSVMLAQTETETTRSQTAVRAYE